MFSPSTTQTPYKRTILLLFIYFNQFDIPLYLKLINRYYIEFLILCHTLYTTPKAPFPSSAPILRSTSLTILSLAVLGLTFDGLSGSLSSIPVSTIVIFTAVSLARARLRQCHTRIMSKTITKNVNTTTALSINGICSESLLKSNKNNVMDG